MIDDHDIQRGSRSLLGAKVDATAIPPKLLQAFKEFRDLEDG